MSDVKPYKDGSVLFDPLLVIGKEFISSCGIQTHYYDYSFGVTPFLSAAKRKKGAPEHYEYDWSGYINIGLDARMHIHNQDNDIGLFLTETKFQLLKDSLEDFVKEFKTRMKTPAKKQVSVKTWLNPMDSRFTGYISYNLDENGNGNLSISDCHKANVMWFYVTRDDAGRVRGKGWSSREVQVVEDLIKGINKAIKGIQSLRKFFEREVTDSPLEK